MADVDRNHDQGSASSQKSKADQLARTRRNQQRCRERKRTHIAELERQVEALQSKIRQCEPCASASPFDQESALDTALRENAARRDLLSALGFDDETQQRFIESADKRQIVYTILQGEREHTSPSSNPGERLSEVPLATRTRFNAQPARGFAESADLEFGGGQAMDSFQTNLKRTDLAVNRQAGAVNPATEDWFLSAGTLDQVPTPFIDPAGDNSWLMDSYNSYLDFAHGSVDAVEPTHSMLALGALPTFSLEGGSDEVHLDPLTSINDESDDAKSIERCFLDTVVQCQPGDTSTVCSTALALIFQYNRKGLSMAELQKQLKPGVRAPSGTTIECCIENSVLFRVLADIST